MHKWQKQSGWATPSSREVHDQWHGFLKQRVQSNMHWMEVITLSFSWLSWVWSAASWAEGGTAAGSACAGGGAAAGCPGTACCCWTADACLRRALRAGAVGGAGLDGGGVAAAAFWGAGLPAAAGMLPPAAGAAETEIGCTGCHTDRYQTTMLWARGHLTVCFWLVLQVIIKYWNLHF